MNTRVQQTARFWGKVIFTLLIVLGLSGTWASALAASGAVKNEKHEASKDIDGDVGPSFDCAKASTEVERVICDSPELSKLDRKLSELYGQLIELPGRKEPLRRAQLKWLREERNTCKDATMPPGYDHPKEVAIERCLYPVYSKRIKELRRSEVCHAFSSLVEEYGFEALVDSENLRNNKYGIEIPDIDPVVDEKIRSLPESSIAWGYVNADQYSDEERKKIIKERTESFRSAVKRWGVDMFQASFDYDGDGGLENLIIFRPVNEKVKAIDFRGKYFVFDENFNIENKYYTYGGRTGWTFKFLGDPYQYSTGYSARKEKREVYVSKIYDPPSAVRVRPKQICQVEDNVEGEIR